MATISRFNPRLSTTERAVLRELRDKRKKIADLQHKVEQLTPRAAKILQSAGGSATVGNTILQTDHATRLVFSAEVQELEAQLAALKAKETQDGTAVPEPGLPAVTISPAT